MSKNRIFRLEPAHTLATVLALAGYLFLETFSNFVTPSGHLLDARSELCDARKEGLFAPGAPP